MTKNKQNHASFGGHAKRLRQSFSVKTEHVARTLDVLLGTERPSGNVSAE